MAEVVPERICKRTGVEGGTNAASLMKNSEPVCNYKYISARRMPCDGTDTDEREHHVKGQVDAIDFSGAGGSQVLERDQVCLVESKDGGRLVRSRFNLCGTSVAEDGRIDATVKGSGTGVGLSTDPVIVDVLIGRELYRELSISSAPIGTKTYDE